MKMIKDMLPPGPSFFYPVAELWRNPKIREYNARGIADFWNFIPKPATAGISGYNGTAPERTLLGPAIPDFRNLAG
ncbi:hypothetical protein [Succinimonas amylolytica]|uniref:hypothetical protein n=1 Tax=Succinimonas amylolytica TaxID=83769 RepID=UPI00036D55A2|nr:hypothetical protein [Succinimonas amylolytica]